jgi:hypothetical protein
MHKHDRILSDYGDDSDYEDYEDYGDYRALLPERRAMSAVHSTVNERIQDDLYIASEEAEDRARRLADTRGAESEAMDGVSELLVGSRAF